LLHKIIKYNLYYSLTLIRSKIITEYQEQLTNKIQLAVENVHYYIISDVENVVDMFVSQKKKTQACQD
jgi:hypothetical protein